MSELEEQDIYVLLDFQSKDMSKLLKQQSTYFRMLNLSEPNPIVELGDDVFEGVYEDAIGTNVYFTEIENATKPDLFEGETPISLKYLLKQSKILKLNHIGTKSKTVLEPCPVEPVGMYIRDDYRVLLNKLQNDELDINDYLTDVLHLNTDEDDSESDQQSVVEEVPVEPIPTVREPVEPITSSSQPEWFRNNENATKDNPIYNKYVKLLKLVEEPRKSECSQFNDKSVVSGPLNFYNWKNAMMRVVEQQQIHFDVNQDDLNHYVDVENSIKTGVIEGPFTGTPDEKRKLFSFGNFINLSPLMKLIVLHDCVSFEKAEIENMSDLELAAEDEHGWTPSKRVELLSDFKEELRAHVIARIKDVQRTVNNVKDVNVEINLTDEENNCEEFSDDSNCSE